MHGILRTFTLLITLLFVTSGLASEGKIYKWRDKEGKLHFSDKPPKDNSIDVEEQKVDTSKLTVTSMPRSQRQTPLTDGQCQTAIDNLKNTEPLYRGELVEKLAKKEITDEQFAEGLAKLDDLKRITRPDNCKKAEPESRSLLNCIAENKDARSCIK